MDGITIPFPTRTIAANQETLETLRYFGDQVVEVGERKAEKREHKADSPS
jgi:hypothetical protein